MAKNSNLSAAKAAKNDEYYTRYEDIERELINYEDQLRDKVVYCNCDDVRYSNFLEYMCRVAPHIGIRKVIGSHYDKGASQSYYVTFVPPPNLDHWDGDDWERHLIEMPMEGDGDFRSEASIRLLRQADVVITNPPFSLFREFMAQLIEYNKKFLIIGSMNAISYKEIFPIIKDNNLWLGYNTVKEFKQPDGSIKKFGNILWYTNLETTKRNIPQELFLSYERKDREYPKYDNYDAINIDKGIEIPKDYYGIMGVPITWLRYYCPEQFEILGLARSELSEVPCLKTYDSFKEYKQDGTKTGMTGKKIKCDACLRGKPDKTNYLYDEETDYYVHVVYTRIFIRRRRRE